MCDIWGIDEFIEAAPMKISAAITGSWRAIPTCTNKRNKVRTCGGTQTPMTAFFVSRAFQRKFTFVRARAMKLDFLADGGLVFS